MSNMSAAGFLTIPTFEGVVRADHGLQVGWWKENPSGRRQRLQVTTKLAEALVFSLLLPSPSCWVNTPEDSM